MAFEFELTVLHAFGKYVKGAVVWLEEEVKEILSSEHANKVIKVAAGTHSSVAEATTPTPDATPAAEAAATAPATDEHHD